MNHPDPLCFASLTLAVIMLIITMAACSLARRARDNAKRATENAKRTQENYESLAGRRRPARVWYCSICGQRVALWNEPPNDAHPGTCPSCGQVGNWMS